MEKNRQSIFYASFRAFFSAVSSVFGFFVGCILLLFIFAILAMGSAGSAAPTSNIIQHSDDEGNYRELHKHLPVILQVDIEGAIGLQDLRGKVVCEQLEKSRLDFFEDSPVAGILLHINSPGGGVFDTDEIYRALLQYKERYKVPVYAYVEGLCASAGYYIACSADRIYASEVSIVGSVGVVSFYFNVAETLEKLGIKSKTLAIGKGKDDMNSFREWRPDEDHAVKEISEFFYDRFVNVVLKARPQISREELVDTYGAAVFPAVQAQDKGYIDVASADRSRVLRDLTQELDIQKYVVVSINPKGWLEGFMESSPLMGGTLNHALDTELFNGSLSFTQ